MSEITIPALEVVARFSAPEPMPQSLAYDGQHWWVGSWETKNVVAVDRTGRLHTQFAAPGKPVGSVFAQGKLFSVISDDNDDRTVRSVDRKGAWADDAFACPDESGSFLSWDGASLWLSQRFNKRVLRLDPTTHMPLQTIEIGEQILGQTWIGDWLYLSLWLGKERGGARLARILPTAPDDLQHVAASTFAMVSLAYDGDTLWTNDSRGQSIVGLSLPEKTL